MSFLGFYSQVRGWEAGSLELRLGDVQTTVVAEIR